MEAWKRAVFCVHMLLNRNAGISHILALTYHVFNFSANNSIFFSSLPSPFLFLVFIVQASRSCWFLGAKDKTVFLGIMYVIITITGDF